MYLGSGGVPKKAADQDKAINWQKGGISGSGEAGAGGASMANPSVCRKPEVEAVVFSIQFYGKTIGEVGLLDQDLSQLDWQKFKSYINLLSMNNQENVCVSYSDDEGDKLPIESEEEYREALKVAKKKAEAHDKLVLDITRQGGLPTVFSIVSSGIKRVSSSPPKEGGMSFFKTASPPKDSSGFMARTSAPDRKIFSLFSNDRGDDEMAAGGALHKDTQRHYEQPPEWFSTYMNKFRDELCEDVTVKLAHLMREEGLAAPKADKKPDNKFSQVEMKESTLHCTSLRPGTAVVKDFSQPSQLQTDVQNFWAKTPLHRRRCTAAPPLKMFVPPPRSQRKSSNPQKRGSFVIAFTEGKGTSSKENSSDAESHYKKKEGDLKDDSKSVNTGVKLVNPQKRSSFQIGFTELSDMAKDKTADGESHPRKKERDGKEITKSADVGVKRKKNVKEDEQFTKWMEKMEEKMAKRQGKMEERFIKKHEKLDERLVKMQEKLAERFQKQQEKVEKRKPSGRRLQVDVEKSMRAQGKVFAKMEGLRKKQTCSAEELSKLRKVVDKHHRGSDRHHEGKVADQRQFRRSERRAGCVRPGKSRKIDIDAKAYPVDPSLLQKALLELESLAEDSPGERRSSATLGYDAFYVRDITYPDGSQVPIGAEFVKTWRVLNSGLLPWNGKTELCKWTRVQFHGSPVDRKLRPLEKKVVCPPLKPGECGNISITFIAPNEPGWYATHWRFCQQGNVFGNQIWCAVHVSDNLDANQVAQTACGGDEASPEEVQTSPPEDNEGKECPETVTFEEQSEELSEEDTPIFIDAAKDVSKMENSTVRVAIVLNADATQDSGVEPPPPKEEEQQAAEYEVGIIENYYDAEDSAEEDTQHVGGGDRDSPSDLEKISADLILFEEEAELVPSRPESPDVASQVHFVVPLKDIAKESVDSLRDLIKDSAAEKDKRNSCDELSEIDGFDELSISSESFSDLDSDDQAILNESDTDVSDQDYFVVTMPECFDLTHPYLGTVSVNPPESKHWITRHADAERHADSPDFLTADEDDRTTALAYDYMHYQDESAASNTSGVDDNEGVSLTGTVLEMPRSSGSENENTQSTQDLKTTESNLPSLPLPPTETKGFMDIPPEALRTNLALALYKEAVARPEAEQQQQQQQEPGRATWGSGREERQEVVCEQPVSAQVKDGASPQSQNKASPSASVVGEGSGQGIPTVGSSTQQQLSGDRAAALPDELVSIIPEDLVRGVWNTARTFITRINQEMLSPSANGPGRVGDHEGAAGAASPPHPTQGPPQQDKGTEVPSTPTPQAAEEPSLPPPLQQLADMGFSNHEMNQCLLTKYNNDVACAVAELIVLNCQ